MEKAQTEALIAEARAAMAQAYAPYSKFQVGAALLTEGGEIITGCNVENASFGATICAERTAITRAVAMGHRRFSGIAVIASCAEIVTPCGICRQVLREFSTDMPVICAGSGGDFVETSVAELLPRSFGPEYL